MRLVAHASSRPERPSRRCRPSGKGRWQDSAPRTPLQSQSHVPARSQPAPCPTRAPAERILLAAQLALPHVVLHDCVAAREAIIGAQAIEDSLRRVPLLRWFALVFPQNSVDHTQPRHQLGPLRRFFPPVARRCRMAQHLVHRHTRQRATSARSCPSPVQLVAPAHKAPLCTSLRCCTKQLLTATAS